MSVLINQPFQQLPFSPNIEDQFRLRPDAHGTICFTPIIPKGKFIPFFIIADSDNIGDINLMCWDEPFMYSRTESFRKEGCITGEGSWVDYTKVYYSEISINEAQKLAENDTLFYSEGQAYANLNGVCETNYALDGNLDIFTDGNNDRFIIY